MDMDKYYPFNAVAGDRLHDADDLARILKALITTGVAMKSATDLQVQASGDFNVTVKAGTCVVEGRIGVNDSDKTFTLSAPFAGADRIDRIVARADYANRKNVLVYVQGSPASAPVAPALKADADGYDLPLARIAVSRTAAAITQAVITDERALCSPVVPSNIDALFIQFQTSFNAWFATVQNTLGADAAGNLLNLINYHAPVTHSISLPVSAWTGTGPYTQTATVTGMLATDTPLADVVLSDTAETAKAQLEAYALVGRIDTAADEVTVTCYDNAPTVDLTVRLKVGR